MLTSLIVRAEGYYLKRGRNLLKPARKEDIALTIKLAKEKFNVDLPNDYIEFLRFRNGFWFEGLLIYSAKYTNIEDIDEGALKTNIIDVNEAWREGNLGKWNLDYFYFGESNLDLFALNLKTNKYEQQDRSSADVIESFSDFASMMIPALKSYVESKEIKK